MGYNLGMFIDYIKNLILGNAEKKPNAKIFNLFKKNYNGSAKEYARKQENHYRLFDIQQTIDKFI